jgi:hypothetical protein
MALLGIPCIVQRGNSITLEVFDTFTNIKGHHHHGEEDCNTCSAQAAAV